MSGGPFSILGIGGGNAQPAQPRGILDTVGQAFADNAGMLMGYGSGGFDGAMQGMVQDDRTRLIRQKQAEEKQLRVAARQEAQKHGIDPAIAEANPDFVFQIAAKKYEPKTPQLIGSAETGYTWATPGQPLPEAFTKGTGPKVNWEKATRKRHDGSEEVFFFNPRDPRQTMPAPGETGARAPTNRFAPHGGYKEHEAKAATFGNRASEAHAIAIDNENAFLSAPDASKDNMLPGPIANWAVSDEYRQAKQAKEDFITAVLRKESGASIQPDEFKREEAKYFPKPNDDPKTVEQKRLARQRAVEGLFAEAGQGYTTPKVWDDIDQRRPKDLSKKKDGPVSGGASAAVKGRVFQHRSGATVERLD